MPAAGSMQPAVVQINIHHMQNGLVDLQCVNKVHLPLPHAPEDDLFSSRGPFLELRFPILSLIYEILVESVDFC